MLRYIGYRLFRAVIVIWLASTVVFFALRTIGDPAEMILSQVGASAAEVQRMRVFLKLDTPLSIQYLNFLKSAIKGDFGRSFRFREPALPIILQRLPDTLILTVAAAIIAIVFGTILGVLAAIKSNSFIEQIVMFIALMGQSIPVFWLGIMLIMVFGVYLDLIPATGSGTFKHLLGPAFCLSTFTMASIARLIRSSLLDVISQDYIRTAHAKGLTFNKIITKHALKNALLPVITLVGVQISFLLGGSVVIETVFDWPGIGSMIFRSVMSRDFPMVQAATIIFSITVVFANLSVDILYFYIDPRIKIP